MICERCGRRTHGSPWCPTTCDPRVLNDERIANLLDAAAAAVLLGAILAIFILIERSIA